MDFRKNIFSSNNLPKGTKFDVKKTRRGWRIVYPIRNEDGSFNWFNFITGGSWFNLIMVAIIVAVILLATYEYSSNINALLDCFKSPTQLEICKEVFVP